eukprot:10047061-Alexandrium_andersonii.AAC.1
MWNCETGNGGEWFARLAQRMGIVGINRFGINRSRAALCRLCSNYACELPAEVKAAWNCLPLAEK